jgi:hypothetical protein
MWGIILTNAAGEQVDEVTIDAPFESLRERCRNLVEARPDAAQARLRSSDGFFDYVYPEPGALAGR